MAHKRRRLPYAIIPTIFVDAVSRNEKRQYRNCNAYVFHFIHI